MMIRPLLDLHGFKLTHRIRTQRFNISSYSSLCGEIQNHVGSLDKAESELQTQILLWLERLSAKQ